MHRNLLMGLTLLMTVACAQNGGTQRTAVDAEAPLFSVLPNKTLHLSIRVEGDAIADLSQVYNESESNLEFSRSAMDNDGVMMSIQNSTTNILKFDLFMVDVRGERHYTSSCPVMADGGLFEMWPHPIPEILVTNIRVLPEGAPMVCQ